MAKKGDSSHARRPNMPVPRCLLAWNKSWSHLGVRPIKVAKGGVLKNCARGLEKHRYSTAWVVGRCY